MKVPHILLPIGAVCIGLGVAFVLPAATHATGHGAAENAPASAAENASASAAGSGVVEAPTPPSGARIQGTVLEVIDVPNYVYLRLGSPGSEGTWTAVPSASVRVGQNLEVSEAQEMQHFTSSTLKRTFDRIYFGVLSDSQHPTEAPHDHGRMAGSFQAENGEWAGGSDPHSGPGANAEKVPVGEVARARGASGVTVAEVYRRAAELTGKTVRLRAVVVKSTSGVMGRTFVHLRDKTGSVSAKDNDVTVTTDEQPAVGATVLFEGTVARDVDFGSGYRYPVLLEHARSVSE